jgi:elongation factor Ts
MHIAASNPLALTSDLIDQSVIDKEQELSNRRVKKFWKT